MKVNLNTVKFENLDGSKKELEKPLYDLLANQIFNSAETIQMDDFARKIYKGKGVFESDAEELNLLIAATENIRFIMWLKRPLTDYLKSLLTTKK